jgi:hypothetical protein
MPRFIVTVTRDTTESTTVEIDAVDADAASEYAIGYTSNNPNIEWEQDDTPNASSDHYVTGVEEDDYHGECGQCVGTGTIEGGIGGDGDDEECPICDGTGEL